MLNTYNQEVQQSEQKRRESLGILLGKKQQHLAEAIIWQMKLCLQV